MGSKFQLTLHTTYGGKPFLNMFGFEDTGAGGTAADLGTQWLAGVVGHIQGIIVKWVIGWSVDVINFNDLADYWSGVPVTQQGAVDDDGLPPQTPYSFEYVRGTRASRNGWKRFTGVPETYQKNGILGSTALSNAHAVEPYLLAPVAGATSAVYTPRILRLNYPKPNPSHLPPTTVTAFPVSNVLYKYLGSQNTRK